MSKQHDEAIAEMTVTYKNVLVVEHPHKMTLDRVNFMRLNIAAQVSALEPPPVVVMVPRGTKVRLVECPPANRPKKSE